MVATAFKSVRACVFLGAAALAVALVSPSSAAIIVYTASLSGPAEEPPNGSPGTGFTTVTIDTTLSTMRVQTSFSGLVGTTTASHIHAATAVPMAGTAGVATQTPSFSGFPLGVTSGSMDTTFDMLVASSYNPAFVAANGGTPASAFSAFSTALSQGRAYLNIHSTSFPSGEIRGFLVPAPGGAALLGFAGLLAMRRRR